jgi:hypothetical protein
MDPSAGFDEEHEDFFRAYDAERASHSLATFEPDEPEPAPPSPEQLAHFARFRKPVALFLGAMAVLSLTALGLRSSQHGFSAPTTAHAQRTLVAHYASAIPAAAPLASAGGVLAAPYDGAVWQTFSAAPNKCLLDPSADSAWLSVALAEPANVEWSAVRLGHASSARGRRPTYTSSSNAHITATARLTPGAHVASPVATPNVTTAATATTPVARFPDKP